MIRITQRIAIEESEIEERFIRSPGPGGQNVNKVSSAVQLRFDAARSPALDAGTLARLATLAGRRMSRDGILTITAHGQRSQERNRDDALARLTELIRQASVAPTIRRPTRVPRAAKRDRLEGKMRRSATKRLRRVEAED